MEKKTIVAIVVGTAVAATAGGVILKKFIFNGNDNDDKKQIVKVDDIVSIDRLVKELASRNDIDIDDEDVFIISSGIVAWAIRNDKKELTPEQFGDAAKLAINKAGLDITF